MTSKTTTARAVKRATLKAINRAFYYLDGPQDGFSTVREILFRLNLASERQHRKTRPGPHGLTITQAAKLFTVQHIAQGLIDPDRYTIDDINSVRIECLKAQAYAKRHSAAFLAAFALAGLTPEETLFWDYAELMA